MGWDESLSETFLQREKEEAHDYRYFPDPDLMPVEVDDAWLNELNSKIGELPAARRKRYVEKLGLTAADATILASDRALGDFFERATAIEPAHKRVANLIINVVSSLANEQNKPVTGAGISPARVAQVAGLIERDLLAANQATEVFRHLGPDDLDDASLQMRLRELNLLQVSDTRSIDAAIDAAISANPKAVADFRAGKQAALGSLVGAVMKNAKGLNPKIVQERLKARLS